MNKKDYGNSLVRQAYVGADVVKAVSEHVSYRRLHNVLPMKEIMDAQKVILTGCGDSWLAGIAAQPVFEGVAKINCDAMRNIDFTRHLSGKALGFSPNTPMVIGISIGGNKARPIEAMERATHYHANSIGITATPDSVFAKAARHVLTLGMPEGEYSPGSNSYSASIVALDLIALRMARARNTISQNEYEDMKKAMIDYAEAFQAEIPALDDHAFAVAQKLKDMRALDFIGDHADYATAFFGNAKVLEAYGGYTTYDDSEDWNHINYFLKDPESIGRVVVANSETPSFGRIQETLLAIEKLGSPCVVISDADASAFPSSCEVFTTPKPKYFWLNPLMQHHVFNMVAGYIAELKGVPNFLRERTDLIKEATDTLVRLTNSQRIIV